MTTKIERIIEFLEEKPELAYPVKGMAKELKLNERTVYTCLYYGVKYGRLEEDKSLREGRVKFWGCKNK